MKDVLSCILSLPELTASDRSLDTKKATPHTHTIVRKVTEMATYGTGYYAGHTKNG